MIRKALFKIVGMIFMLGGLYFAGQAVALFVQNHAWGSLLMNLLGAVLFFAVGAFASGLIGYILHRRNIRIDPYKFKMTVTIILIVTAILCGLCLLWFGIKEAVAFDNETRDYERVQGYFVGYQVQFQTEEKTVYSLTYKYYVDGIEYTVTANSDAEAFPQKGAEREIYYDSQNPEKAVVSSSRHIALLFGAALFIGVPLVFIVVLLYGAGYISLDKINVIELVMGLVLIVAGLGAMYIIGGSLSPIDAFAYAGLMVLIPVLMSVAGAYVAIRGIFFHKKK